MSSSSVVESGAAIEYQEKIVEVPEVVVQESVKRVPRVEVQECVVEVPRVVYKEKIVEVPEIEYVDVPVERVVEVPEVREEVVIKEVFVPQYVEKPVPEYVTVEVPHDVHRNVPVPVESETTYDLVMPNLKPVYRTIKVPIYVPRFIEVPIPAELLDESAVAEAEHLGDQVKLLTQQDAPSLKDVERLAEYIKNTDFQAHLRPENVEQTIAHAFETGKLSQTTL